MIRVLLADDHDVVREGLARLFRGEKDIELVAAVSDGSAAVASARQCQPDVVVVDAAMPRMSGIEAARQIRSLLPGVHVVAMSLHMDSDLIDQMREAGAEAYLDKAGPYEDLLAAVRRCCRKEPQSSQAYSAEAAASAAKAGRTTKGTKDGKAQKD
jgi:DNA-binding NarL/FixJ family response regulator